MGDASVFSVGATRASPAERRSTKPGRRVRRPYIVMCALLTLVLAGCVPKSNVREPYYGETLALPALVEQINQRNARIDALRVEGDFSARLIDPMTKKVTSGDGDVTILYMPRRNLRLVGQVLTERIFEIGSNDDRYWLIIRHDTDTMWWGYHRLIGSAPNILPIRPDLITEVLGVGALDADLLKEPAPVVRFNNDQDAYMLTWQVLLSDRWAVQKEVWYDRKTLLPRLVLLFDANGRIVVRAYLAKPQSVEGYDPDLKIASEYGMFFPDSGSTFKVRLKSLKRTQNNVPTERSFNFPGERAGVSKVIQIDE